MTRIVGGLSGGWTLGYVVSPSTRFIYPEMPIFRGLGGVERTPFEVARQPEGRRVFFEVKRWLDEADVRYGYGAQSRPDWRAVDKAKMAMQSELVRIGAWDDELLDTGVKVA